MSPIDLTPLPMVTDVRLDALAKAVLLMPVVASGMTTDVRPVLAKAERPMNRTPLPMVTDVSAEQSWYA